MSLINSVTAFLATPIFLLPTLTAPSRTSASALHVCDPARPTRLLTDVLELEVSAILDLEQPDDAGSFHLFAFESRRLTQLETPECQCSYARLLLELFTVGGGARAQGAMALPFRHTLPAAHSKRQPSGSCSSATSVIIRCVGSTWPNTSIVSCTSRAAPTLQTSSCRVPRKRFPDGPSPAASRHTRATTSIHIECNAGACLSALFCVCG